jgi:hypothetical protein
MDPKWPLYSGISVNVKVDAKEVASSVGAKR